MDRKTIGYILTSFGLGIIASAIIYPLGYLESEAVFYTMTSTGITFAFIGRMVRPSVKSNSEN